MLMVFITKKLDFGLIAPQHMITNVTPMMAVEVQVLKYVGFSQKGLYKFK